MLQIVFNALLAFLVGGATTYWLGGSVETNLLFAGVGAIIGWLLVRLG